MGTLRAYRFEIVIGLSGVNIIVDVDVVYSGHALSFEIVYRHTTESEETNILNEHNIVKNPTRRQEEGQLAIYKG